MASKTTRNYAFRAPFHVGDEIKEDFGDYSNGVRSIFDLYKMHKHEYKNIASKSPKLATEICSLGVEIIQAIVTLGNYRSALIQQLPHLEDDIDALSDAELINLIFFAIWC